MPERRGMLDSLTIRALIVNQNRPQDIIVFMLGGTTYEESRAVALLNQRLASDREGGPGGTRILLGGSTVHNSSSYVHLTPPRRLWVSPDEVDSSIWSRHAPKTSLHQSTIPQQLPPELRPYCPQLRLAETDPRNQVSIFAQEVMSSMLVDPPDQGCIERLRMPERVFNCLVNSRLLLRGFGMEPGGCGVMSGKESRRGSVGRVHRRGTGRWCSTVYITI